MIELLNKAQRCIAGLWCFMKDCTTLRWYTNEVWLQCTEQQSQD